VIFLVVLFLVLLCFGDRLVAFRADIDDASEVIPLSGLVVVIVLVPRYLD
jgi:hypothetical protein